MTGSCASNLGYAKIYPNSNVNPNYVNIGSTNYSGGFGSNEIPGPPNLPGLVAAKNNVDAAAGRLPTFHYKGGGSAKGFKRKIKNITKKYKMSKKSLKKRASALRRKIKRRMTKSKRSRRHRQRGGYDQYQNNLPMTTSYSTGGYLNPSNSALANPVPYKILPNVGNCVDNYNHYTNKGFPSSH
jgi:hypothetical protein